MECRTLVVGGGAAGLFAALQAARHGSVIVLEAGPGLGSPPAQNLTDGYSFPDDYLYRYLDHDSGNVVRQGRGLGGGSTVNIAAALRGTPSCYDGWSVPGWGWDDVLPAFRAIESDGEFGDQSYHGSTGPISILRRDASRFDEAIFAACADHGGQRISDHNAPGAYGYGMWPTNRRGRARCGSALAVAPLVRQAGGEIRTGCRVDRLRFERGHCTGADFVGPDGPGQVWADQAVVCAGAYGTPALLCRSGIGPADTLADLGVSPVAVLDGVGKNLQDHPRCVLEVELRDDSLMGETAVNGALYRFRLNAGQRAEGQVFAVGAHELDCRSPVGTVRVTAALMAPASVGRLEIRSHGVELHQGLVAERSDTEGLASVVRTADELVRGLEAADIVTAPEGAWWRAADARELGRRCAQRVITYSHACGTCRMGTDPAEGAVVDAHLRVLGVSGLRVADSSVIPRIPQANTNLPSMMIGYRGGGMTSE